MNYDIMDDMTHRGARQRLRAATCWAVAGLILAGGCTDDSPGDGDPAPDVALEVSIVEGGGRLDQQQQIAVEAEIGDVLSSYVVEGFLGSFPRANFLRAFDSFTIGVVEKAARDVEVLTAAEFEDAEQVRAEELVAEISCLVTGGQAVGATAHVSFEFEAERDGATEHLLLRGRILLAREGGAWSIFGYDVDRKDSAGGSA